MLGENINMGIEDHKNIALLIFALSPEAELQQKNLAPSKGIYALLNQHTLELAKEFGIPYFHITEKEQQGDTFGERYTHAISKIFAQGYNGVITIGNDTPGLNRNHLQTALNSLLSGSAVIGPSLDGGFYLLAIPRSSFYIEEFLSISWQSSCVFRQMQAYLQEKNYRLWVLNPLGDLDTCSDIDLVLDQSINIPFGIKRALQKIRLKARVVNGALVFHYSIHTHTRILNRGSPAAA